MLTDINWGKRCSLGLYGNIGPASVSGTGLQLQFGIFATKQNSVSDICRIILIRKCCIVLFAFYKSPARTSVSNTNFGQTKNRFRAKDGIRVDVLELKGYEYHKAV